MIGFAKRNLLVFFRDKTSVFFSLLAVFIIIGLYALFLGDVWTSSFSDMQGVRFLMDSWITAGLLAVTSVTTSMGAFGTMVEDKVKKITKDFTSSPIKRREIMGGYTLSAYIIGVIMCLIALILLQIYIVAGGGQLMSLPVLLKVFGLILLCTFTNTSIVLFVVTFFESNNAFATASTIIGTLIGFLTGIYLPIGQLPEAVQWVVRLFPVSHAASLFRQVLMQVPISIPFSGAPAEAVTSFEKLMGVKLYFGDTPVQLLVNIGVLILTAVIFYGLTVLRISRKKR